MFDMSNLAANSAASPANMLEGQGMTPALAAAFLSGSLAYPQMHQQQFHQQQEQQQINAYAQALAVSGGSMSAPPSSAMEASGAYSVPSPLDLNSIFGLLGSTAGQTSAVSPAYSGMNSMPTQQEGQSSSQFPSPAANAGSSGSGSHEDMLLDDMSKQADRAGTADLFKDDSSNFPLAFAQFFKQQQSSASVESNSNGSFDNQTSNNAAPLTPASFMNLPSNQYDLLAGLIADQSNLISVPDSDMGQRQQVNGTPADLTPYPHRQQQQASANPLDGVKASSAGPAGKVDEINRTSPAFKAVQERAAAALAEKEAKALSKGRGKKRSATADTAASNSALIATQMQTSATGRKNGKRAAGTEMDFESNAGPAARSGNASLETSPNLLPTDTRKSSHKVAEQKRRDSLKLCFEELRFILPPLTMEECDDDFVSGMGKRPGENNVGGQRGKASAIDPKHPNKGVSKVALLRKSNECNSSSLRAAEKPLLTVFGDYRCHKAPRTHRQARCGYTDTPRRIKSMSPRFGTRC
jgi:hypothetical protein